MAIKQDVLIKMSVAQSEALADFIEDNIFQTIRNDTEINNIAWLYDMCKLWERLKNPKEFSVEKAEKTEEKEKKTTENVEKNTEKTKESVEKSEDIKEALHNVAKQIKAVEKEVWFNDGIVLLPKDENPKYAGPGKVFDESGIFLYVDEEKYKYLLHGKDPDKWRVEYQGKTVIPVKRPMHRTYNCDDQLNI